MLKYTETKLRTLTKALLLRVIVFTIITLSTVYFFEQSFLEGLEFGIMDIIIELCVHFGYDRVWLCIELGVIEIKQPIEENIQENEDI